MPTMRTPLKRKSRSGNITPQVVAAYQRALALYNDPKSDEYEEDGKGGRKRELYAACSHLDELLGRHSGDVGIFDTVGDDTGAGYDGWGTVEEWKAAISLRLEIERASDAAQR